LSLRPSCLWVPRFFCSPVFTREANLLSFFFFLPRRCDACSHMIFAAVVVMFPGHSGHLVTCIHLLVADSLLFLANHGFSPSYAILGKFPHATLPDFFKAFFTPLVDFRYSLFLFFKGRSLRCGRTGAGLGKSRQSTPLLPRPWHVWIQHWRIF